MQVARGRRVLLRLFEEGDREHFIRWMSGDGRWKRMDAPWLSRPWSEEERRRAERQFSGFLLQGRRRAIIVDLSDGAPVGWVACNVDSAHPDACEVTIAVCEEDRQGRGLGSEALALWVDYLFDSRFHRVTLRIYSLNTFMRRTSEKLGFKLEGVEREVHLWNEAWVDRLTFGVLAGEWRMPDL